MKNNKNEYVKSLIVIVSFLCCVFSANAQKVLDLSGQWQFQLDRDNVGMSQGWFEEKFDFTDNIALPASMPQRLKGNDITVDTQWMGGLYDSSYYHNPYMEKYRVEGNVKVPFFLTPAKHYVGRAWYKRSVNIDRVRYKNGSAITYRLFLERPHIATTVWVNGNKLTTNDGKPSSNNDAVNTLSVPHIYYLSEKDGLRVGENVITICVDNRLEVANVGKDSHSVTDQTQGDWNGIVGRMELSETGLINSVKVFPDVDAKKAIVRLNLGNTAIVKNTAATIRLKAESFNSEKTHVVVSEPLKITLPAASSFDREIVLSMGDDMLLWDEFNPQLYRLSVEVETKDCTSATETVFGMRKIEIRGKAFYLNNREIQLRGTVENCCFPLTGFPPTDLESWLKVFRTCKQWGLNHMRFHSYCPPEAAFLAADMTGFYIQPEGPSWPNHGVKLGRGEFVDEYLYDEGVRIMDEYGNHPSFTFFAFGNEPAGNWVKWSNEHSPRISQYDSRHVCCGFSVGGGWAWQPKVDYAVKAGARGLDSWKNKAPESTFNFNSNVHTYNGKDMPGTKITIPFVSHETGQWCVFPNFKEIPKYKGVNKAGNLEIFRDLLRDNGMADMADKFLYASGKLQSLCYKYELERHLRTPEYAGFQLLGLNDYSGQGTALVGVLDVFWDEKGYITAPEWREFCSPVVPLAKIDKFTYTNNETFEAKLEFSNYAKEPLENKEIRWTITGTDSKNNTYSYEGKNFMRNIPIGQNCEIGAVSQPLSEIKEATKLTLTVSIPGTDVKNHWNFWVYPSTESKQTATNNMEGDVYVTDSLDAKAVKILGKGGKVLICAARKVSYGKEVKQQFTPVFWNTSWFKMRPPHTTGIYVDNAHAAFREFPTECHSDLQWWELVNNAQVMQFTDFPRDFQPLVQSIDTWFVSRKIGMLFEANVRIGKSKKVGRLMMTTMDISTKLDSRHAARQMRKSILDYMHSPSFAPQWTIEAEHIADLFTKVAGEVNMFTNDSPDELKPKLK